MQNGLIAKRRNFKKWGELIADLNFTQKTVDKTLKMTMPQGHSLCTTAAL
jgi:hypothetical protein